MVTPLSLYVFAAVLLTLAAVVARLRRTGLREALADGRAALVGALLVLAVSILMFAVSPPAPASGLWRVGGSVALLASPLGATLGLRFRGRRSIPRALLGSILALAALVLWLTVHLRGPWGGWTVIEVLFVLAAAAIALAAAACLGWWSKRAATAGVAVAEAG